MEEKQVLEEPELADGVIRRARSLLALKTRDANTYMRSCNHVHIISAIADSQGRLFWLPLPHHQYDLSLLLGADTTGQDDICALTQVHKLLHHQLVFLDRRESLTSDNNGVLTDLFGHTLVADSLLHLDTHINWFYLL